MKRMVKTLVILGLGAVAGGILYDVALLKVPEADFEWHVAKLRERRGQIEDRAEAPF